MPVEKLLNHREWGIKNSPCIWLKKYCAWDGTSGDGLLRKDQSDYRLTEKETLTGARCAIGGPPIDKDQNEHATVKGKRKLLPERGTRSKWDMWNGPNGTTVAY